MRLVIPGILEIPPQVRSINQAIPTRFTLMANPGRYLVTLTAKNSSGTTRVFTDFVTVNEPPKPPVAKFSIENNNVIGPATISFSNTSENANIYKWDFDDPESGIKNTSDEASPVHTYLKPGNYKVRLTASEKLTGTMNETDMVVTILEPILPLVVDFTYTLSGKYAPLMYHLPTSRKMLTPINGFLETASPGKTNHREPILSTGMRSPAHIPSRWKRGVPDQEKHRWPSRKLPSVKSTILT